MGLKTECQRFEVRSNGMRVQLRSRAGCHWHSAHFARIGLAAARPVSLRSNKHYPGYWHALRYGCGKPELDSLIYGDTGYLETLPARDAYGRLRITVDDAGVLDGWSPVP